MTHASIYIKFSKNISVAKADELFTFLENNWWREGANSSDEYESIGIDDNVDIDTLKDDFKYIIDFASENKIKLNGFVSFIGDNSVYIDFEMRNLD